MVDMHAQLSVGYEPCRSKEDCYPSCAGVQGLGFWVWGLNGGFLNLGFT